MFSRSSGVKEKVEKKKISDGEEQRAAHKVLRNHRLWVELTLAKAGPFQNCLKGENIFADNEYFS